MDELLKLDERFFLWLNGFHTPWLDPIMAFLTKTQVWIPLYLALIYLIVKGYKKNCWIILIGLILTIAITDQLTTRLKLYAERLRPSHEPALADVIHLVSNETGGSYGFASSHAANTFGVAVFTWLSLRRKKKLIWLIFGWSTIMSYSRIYLGLHYPGDILVGALIGLVTGWGLWMVTEKVCNKLISQLPAQ